ncbi:hypothetical protein T09_10511 [Trichinella sp. T9]|nr:hypothetical protein T09_10511 [Trichinella sp. T9]
MLINRLFSQKLFCYSIQAFQNYANQDGQYNNNA